MDIFQKRKKDVLSKLDKSRIGGWDKRIKRLCDKINSLENYYTTSSCSGRIILIIDAEKKGENLFVFVSHDKVRFQDLKRILNDLLSPSAREINCSGQTSSSSSLKKSVNDTIKSKLDEAAKRKSSLRSLSFAIQSNERGDNKSERSELNELKNKKIKFKLEPCILHVACESLEDAENLLEKGKLAGLKRTGIIGMRNGITVELNSTEKLEFPLIQDKNILVSDEFLKIVVDEANKKLEKSWGKIERLEGII